MSKRNKDKGRLPPFVPLLKETLESPAWRQLSHGAKALYVSLKPSDPAVVSFGCTVAFARDNGHRQTYRIVGKDEAESCARHPVISVDGCAGANGQAEVEAVRTCPSSASG